MRKLILAALIALVPMVSFAYCQGFTVLNNSNIKSAYVSIANCPGGKQIPLGSSLYIDNDSGFNQYCGRSVAQNETITVHSSASVGLAPLSGGFGYGGYIGAPYDYHVSDPWTEDDSSSGLSIATVDKCTVKVSNLVK